VSLRRRFCRLVPFAFFAAACVASVARAELLSFEGRLVLALPGNDEMEVASGVGLAEVNGPQLESFVIQSAGITGATGFPVTDPGAAPVTSLRVNASIPSGSLGIDPFGGPYGEPSLSHNGLVVHGAVQICMLAPTLPPCFAGLGVQLTTGPGNRGMGIGGVLTAGLSGTLRMSLQGAPFTLHTASITGTTTNGARLTLFSAGSIAGPYLFTSTAGQPGGWLSIVTPTRVVVSSLMEPDETLFGFLRFEVLFLPEPGLFQLLSAGSAGLALVGWRRRASRKPSPRIDQRGRL